MSSTRKNKKHILALLASDTTTDHLKAILEYPASTSIHAFFAAICNSDSTLRWNGIRYFGPVMAKLSEDDLEAARVVMRRFLWSLNDESGGIGWGAPEAMAEVMVHAKQLRKEYLHMLVSYCQQDGEEQFQDGNFLELPQLQRGVLWGVCRLAQCDKNYFQKFDITIELNGYLETDDIEVRGLALKAIGYLGYGLRLRGALDKLTHDSGGYLYYKDGEFHQETISTQAVKLIDSL